MYAAKSANISLLKQMTELSPLAIPDQAAIGGNMGKSLRTKGALLYGVIPVCALISGLRAAAMRRLASETPRCGSVCEAEHPGHLNVRGVLRHCVPNKGLHPLRRYAAILA